MKSGGWNKRAVMQAGALLVGALLAAAVAFVITVKIKQAHANRVVMYMAIEMNDIAAVQTLIERGFSVDQELDKRGNRPLHRAAERCAYDVAKHLMEHGANARLKDAIGQTPYEIAVSRCGKDTATCRLLQTSRE